jgi:hypothetical protein
VRRGAGLVQFDDVNLAVERSAAKADADLARTGSRLVPVKIDLARA